MTLYFYFWFQLRILEMTDVHQRRKNVLFCTHSLLQRSPLFVSDFRRLSCRFLFLFSHTFPLLLLHDKILCKRLQWFNDLIPLPAIWSSWPLWRVPSIRFLVDSPASTMHAYFALQLTETLQVSLYSARLVVQGIAAGIETSNILRAFFMFPWILHNPCFLEFFIRWIKEVNTKQFSSIVKLWFFDSPLLIFSSLRRFWHIFPYFWPQKVWSGGRLLSCQSPPRTTFFHPVFSYPIWWTQWNMSTYVTILDLHERSNNRWYFVQHLSNDLRAALVTSMYFSGIGNDASLGRYSLTLGSVWWR